MTKPPKNLFGIWMGEGFPPDPLDMLSVVEYYEDLKKPSRRRKVLLTPEQRHSEARILRLERRMMRPPKNPFGIWLGEGLPPDTFYTLSQDERYEDMAKPSRRKKVPMTLSQRSSLARYLRMRRWGEVAALGDIPREREEDDKN